MARALSQALRRECRKLAGVRRYDHLPVEVVEGNSPPYVVGEPPFYETKTGKRIYHPSAYSKRGWSNMYYRSSTRRVEVGRDWLVKNLNLGGVECLVST